MKLTKDILEKAYKEFDREVGVEPPLQYGNMKLEEFKHELWSTYVSLVEPEDEFSSDTQKVFDALVSEYGETLSEKEQTLDETEIEEITVEDNPDDEIEDEVIDEDEFLDDDFEEDEDDNFDVDDDDDWDDEVDDEFPDDDFDEDEIVPKENERKTEIRERAHALLQSTPTEGNWDDEVEETNPEPIPTQGKSKIERIPRNHYTKNMAMYDALANFPDGMTKKQLLDEMEKLYIENGGTPNMKGTKVHAGISIPTLLVFKAIKKERGLFYLA